MKDHEILEARLKLNHSLEEWAKMLGISKIQAYRIEQPISSKSHRKASKTVVLFIETILAKDAKKGREGALKRL